MSSAARDSSAVWDSAVRDALAVWAHVKNASGGSKLPRDVVSWAAWCRAEWRNDRKSFGDPGVRVLTFGHRVDLNLKRALVTVPIQVVGTDAPPPPGEPDVVEGFCSLARCVPSRRAVALPPLSYHLDSGALSVGDAWGPASAPLEVSRFLTPRERETGAPLLAPVLVVASSCRRWVLCVLLPGTQAEVWDFSGRDPGSAMAALAAAREFLGKDGDDAEISPRLFRPPTGDADTASDPVHDSAVCTMVAIRGMACGPRPPQPGGDGKKGVLGPAYLYVACAVLTLDVDECAMTDDDECAAYGDGAVPSAV